jgi:hypothetical protein
MRRHVLLATAAIAASLALSACGGGGGGGDRLTKAEYEQEVAAIGKTFGEGLGSITNAQSPDEIGPALAAAKEEIGAVAARLDDLNPPEEIEAAHERLVAGLEAFSGDLDKVAGQIEEAAKKAQEDNDPSALFAVFGALASLESIKELQAVEKEFEKAGYDLGLTSAGAAATSTG